MQPTNNEFHFQKLEFVEYKFKNSSSTTQKLIDKYFGHEYDYINRVGADEYLIATVDGRPQIVIKRRPPIIDR